MTDIAVELKNLNWSYNGRKVLDSVSSVIEKGSFTGIIGPNGAGKTTLLKLILRLLHPAGENVFIFGRDIRKYSRKELAGKISYVPQTTGVSFGFSVRQIVEMGRNPHTGIFNTVSDKDKAVIKKAMDETRITELADKDISSISGGELQRVIIARALAQEPAVLAMDEPTSHLDLNHQIHLLSLIRSLSLKKEITVIAVLHDFNHALEYCTSLILMNNGRIEASGPPGEVITPDNMRRIYGLNIEIKLNPFTGRPYMINEYP